MLRDAACVTSLLCNLRTQRPQDRGEKVRERERERERRGGRKGKGRGEREGVERRALISAVVAACPTIQQTETSSCCQYT